MGKGINTGKSTSTHRLSLMAQGKRSLWLLALLMGLCHGAAMGQRFVGKVILGANANQIDGDGLSGYNKPGLLAGLGAAFPIDDHWSFEPEFLFSMKGSRTSQAELDNGVTDRLIVFRLNYLELPLIINYSISDQFVIAGGVHPNVLINARVDAGDNRGFLDDTERWRRLDLCTSLGLEWRFSENMGVNMRYSYSLLPANNLLAAPDRYQIQAGIFPGMRNNTISVSLRYLLKSR